MQTEVCSQQRNSSKTHDITNIRDVGPPLDNYHIRTYVQCTKHQGEPSVLHTQHWPAQCVPHKDWLGTDHSTHLPVKLGHYSLLCLVGRGSSREPNVDWNVPEGTSRSSQCSSDECWSVCGKRGRTHFSLGSCIRKLLVMTDLPVPVGPTSKMGTSCPTQASRKNSCRAVSIVWIMRSATW